MSERITVRDVESAWLGPLQFDCPGEAGVARIVYEALHDSAEKEEGSLYGLDDVTVRFFDSDGEMTRNQFAVSVYQGANVEYERHTIREHGVSQICLTAYE
jgi:hypothetical protein